MPDHIIHPIHAPAQTRTDSKSWAVWSLRAKQRSATTHAGSPQPVARPLKWSHSTAGHSPEDEYGLCPKCLGRKETRVETNVLLIPTRQKDSRARCGHARVTRPRAAFCRPNRSLTSVRGPLFDYPRTGMVHKHSGCAGACWCVAENVCTDLRGNTTGPSPRQLKQRPGC